MWMSQLLFVQKDVDVPAFTQLLSQLLAPELRSPVALKIPPSYTTDILMFLAKLLFLNQNRIGKTP
jgi:hypothetical protein